MVYSCISSCLFLTRDDITMNQKYRKLVIISKWHWKWLRWALILVRAEEIKLNWEGCWSVCRGCLTTRVEEWRDFRCRHPPWYHFIQKSGGRPPVCSSSGIKLGWIYRGSGPKVSMHSNQRIFGWPSLFGSSSHATCMDMSPRSPNLLSKKKVGV